VLDPVVYYLITVCEFNIRGFPLRLSDLQGEHFLAGGRQGVRVVPNQRTGMLNCFL